ncbi:hypothetical protein [Mesorhizobium kowhaii]|uniref:hypothetical protein n=1 Tax=Mesorhizobium kowhaii TaxID=1300272 RepID=UPI00142E2B28
MILEQLVPRNVPGVHAWDGVVHEQTRVELRDASSRRKRPECLPQVIAPLAKNIPIVLLLGQMSAFAVCREEPTIGFKGRDVAAKADCSRVVREWLEVSQTEEKQVFRNTCAAVALGYPGYEARAMTCSWKRLSRTPKKWFFPSAISATAVLRSDAPA